MADAFSYCNSLTEVFVPASVVYLDETAFAGCASLQAITVDSDNAEYRSVDGLLFNKELSGLATCPGGFTGPYIIPPTVKLIGSRCFENCAGLTAITIPTSVTAIRENAFVGCDGLSDVFLLTHDFTFLLDGVFDDLPVGTNLYYFDDYGGFAWWHDPSYNYINMGSRTPVKSWLVSHSQPHDANLDDDLNEDRVSLLLAYGLDLDPRQNLGSGVPSPALDGTTLTLTFYAGNADVTYTVETSTDLQHWNSDGVTLTDLDPSGFRTASVPADSRIRLLRIGVTR